MNYARGLHILRKVLQFKLSFRGLLEAPAPVNLTFSVTNRCQSRCLSCKIWEVYRIDPEKLREELSLEQIERMFRSIGPVYFFNISGGCPFLRSDLPEIVDLALKHLKPSVVHIPTNALAVEKTLKTTEAILKNMAEHHPGTALQIKPSFDGVGEVHDRVRGVEGNFTKLLALYAGLKALQEKYPHLKVGLGTVVSKNNIAHLPEIIDYADRLEPDSYISELAENRDEMFNREDDIAPPPEDFRKAMNEFKTYILSKISARKGLARVTDAFRLFYYDLSAAIMEQKTQVIPCYAGISNAHIDPYGNVWACCVLGNEQSMGNLKDHGFDFFRIWRSGEADAVRRYIKNKNCHCPLANQTYANILCHLPSLLKAARYLLPFKSGSPSDTRR